ncbi:hypothetical protein [Gordoniibacillus kamchatkensis]|uniref:hypothetical protein n=1 Tax=Gordoniibacillus kamchatkensis TaxID=1590651 RepID=UPI000A438180|nr:hypothetical protein [Paenibacillus sp. VKM B-2647]
MDIQPGEAPEGTEDSFAAADFSPVPEGVRGFVDLIGDENIDGWRTGEPSRGDND